MKQNRPGLRLVVGLWVLVAILASGCGRKAPPLPPVVRVAERTHDLRAVQDDSIVHLQWSYPQMTSNGGPLPDLEAVAVWRMAIPAAQEPQAVGAQARTVRAALLEARGEVVTELEGDGLDLATRGALLVIEDDLALAPVIDVDDTVVVWYAVRSRCCNNRWSEYSNIVRIVQDEPPGPPTELIANADRDGIHLEWTTEGKSTTRVERSTGGSEWEVVKTVSTTAWTDDQAAQGTTWSYRLRTVMTSAHDDSERIGPPGPAVLVEHPDVYPPASPGDLVCLPEGSLIRLRWRSADGADAYEVRRHSGENSTEILEKATPHVSFIDEKPPAGNVLYIVRSIDEAGNSSEPARCETVVEGDR